MNSDIFDKYYKTPSELMEFDDFEFLAQQGEAMTIDRKSIRDFSDVKANKDRILPVLSKAMSAFLNYDGGILLIGVDDKTGMIETGIDNGQLGRHTVKEWLVNVLITCVTPFSRDFTVKVVSSNGGVLFAIFFGNSENAPHQAAHGREEQGRYFTRADDNSVRIDGVMVKDIFNRKKYANCKPSIKIRPVSVNSPWIAEMELLIINESAVPTQNACVLMKLSKQVISGGVHGGGMDFEKDRGQFNTDIVYPGLPTCLVKDMHILAFDEYYANFTVVALNMPLREYRFLVRRTPDGSIGIHEVKT